MHPTLDRQAADSGVVVSQGLPIAPAGAGVLKRVRLMWFAGVCTAVFAVLGILAGSGCGSAPDPFLGTWTVPDAGLEVVVALASGQYHVATVQGGHTLQALLFQRHGDKLRADLRVFNEGQPTGQVITEVFEYRPDTGHLLWEESGTRFELEKVNGSTAFPSPLPTDQSPSP
jgi:hypothetical protein